MFKSLKSLASGGYASDLLFWIRPCS